MCLVSLHNGPAGQPYSVCVNVFHFWTQTYQVGFSIWTPWCPDPSHPGSFEEKKPNGISAGPQNNTLMFVSRRVINTKVGTLKTTKDFQEQVIKHIKLWPFLIKGFTAVRPEWILKHIFPILTWKKRHHPSTRGGYSYNHSALWTFLWGALLPYGWFSTHTCTYAALTSLRAGVTHRLLQVNEVNWLLLTYSPRLWSRNLGLVLGERSE